MCVIISFSYVFLFKNNCIFSQKAAERGLFLMTVEWVDAVWNEGLKRNIHATDTVFEKFKCPIFHQLEITTTNLSVQEKNRLKELINSNGKFCIFFSVPVAPICLILSRSFFG